jgi:hypothetical protein
MKRGNLMVSVLTILVSAGVVLFLVSHASRDRLRNESLAVSGERATKFPINGKGLAIPTSTNYVYRVVGPPGTTATITFVKQIGENGYVRHAVLPWSIAIATVVGTQKYPLPAGSGMPPYVVAHTNAHGPNAQVTCQAFGDGKLLDQESAVGNDVIVSCGVAF